ncbi:ABC transporter substrate-binding protein [Kineococcus rhizosphaerae]|uniref:ABC-type branched-subunit amino acid transport system substrate-binding protein n=1 Tax=Kineococcus rhizosphaerae TaxID=559628 RepID=A0A2T0R2V8_9ACTN|nr:ABC transporter substrate-binding protein [Kineococcus rhizosphaerae]PRY14124.1 ABC-type branched-subunit amino acid transport system substrate-binding protein [Kineococcus rhizosphaerae]
MPEDVYRVGLAVPRQGPSGMFGLSCRVAAHQAAQEVNAAGGVGGRRLELVDVDAGAEPAAVAAEVAGLVERGRVDAVAGWHLSSVRQAVAPVLAGRTPYVYATAYEGGEEHDGVVCTGELPGDQVMAALRFLRREFGWHRWVVVGDDYVWPRRTADRVARALAGAGVLLSARHWVPLGCDDDARWAALVGDLARAADGADGVGGVDGVLMLLVGGDGARFNREFAAAGLDGRLVRFSPFMDETMLLASGPEATRGLFASAGWFAGLGTASALEFSAGFARAFDATTQDATGLAVPSPGTMAESTYLALRFLADVGSRAVPTVVDLDRARSAWAWDSPHGTVELRAGRARHRVHLAAAVGLEFDVLAEVTTP